MSGDGSLTRPGQAKLGWGLCIQILSGLILVTNQYIATTDKSAIVNLAEPCSARRVRDRPYIGIADPLVPNQHLRQREPPASLPRPALRCIRDASSTSPRRTLRYFSQKEVTAGTNGVPGGRNLQTAGSAGIEIFPRHESQEHRSQRREEDSRDNPPASRGQREPYRQDQ